MLINLPNAESSKSWDLNLASLDPEPVLSTVTLYILLQKKTETLRGYLTQLKYSVFLVT